MVQLSSPELLVVAVGAVFASVALLWALSMIATSYTALRRSVRNARIAQRAEGWGSPKHRNQELIEAPAFSPLIDLVTKLLPRGSSPDNKDSPNRAA